MTALETLRTAALDGAIWGSADPAKAAEAMADELDALLIEERAAIGDFARRNLEQLSWALRLLQFRLEVS